MKEVFSSNCSAYGFYEAFQDSSKLERVAFQLPYSRLVETEGTQNDAKLKQSHPDLNKKIPRRTLRKASIYIYIYILYIYIYNI